MISFHSFPVYLFTQNEKGKKLKKGKISDRYKHILELISFDYSEAFGYHFPFLIQYQSINQYPFLCLRCCFCISFSYQGKDYSLAMCFHHL